MPSLIEMLRMRNLFDPNQMVGNDLPSQGGITGNMPPLFPGSMDSGNLGMPKTPSPFDNIQFGNTTMPPPNPALNDDTDNYDPGARMKELFHPSHMASDRFDEMINKFPQREQPSKKRMWGGALLGALTAANDTMTVGHDTGRGRGVYEDVTGRTRNREDVEDWKTQMGPLGQAANFERYQNTNERQNAYQTISAELRDHAQELKAKNDSRKADIAEKRAQIYEMKSKGYKFDFSGPTVIATRPDSPTPQDTGVPTGHMTQLDKLNLEAENRAANTTNKGEEDRKTERLREQGRETLADKKGWDVVNIPNPEDPTKQIAVRINRDTGAIEPVKLGGSSVGPVAKPSGSGSTAKPESETNKRVGEYRRARQLWNTNPELRPFIKWGPGANDFSIQQAGRNFMGTPTGPNMDQTKKIADAIYGNNVTTGTTLDLKPPVNSPNMGTQPLSAGAPEPNAGHPNQNTGMQSAKEVPPQQRVPGQVYLMGNGQPGKWMGTHFEAVQ
jgi:hypothetical protein